MQNLKSRATVSHTCFKETSLHESREVPDPVDLTWGWRTLPAQVEIVTVPRMIPMRLVVPSLNMSWVTEVCTTSHFGKVKTRAVGT